MLPIERHSQRGFPISWKSSNITTLCSPLLLHNKDTDLHLNAGNHAPFGPKDLFTTSTLFFNPRNKNSGSRAGLATMEYFMVPAQKVPSLQHFRKTEKEVIGGLCRCVYVLIHYCFYLMHCTTAIRVYVGAQRGNRGGGRNMLDSVCYCVYKSHSAMSGIQRP